MVVQDGHHHLHPLLSTEASGSHSPGTKRKVESSFGLFCVMRKRARGDISVDDDDMSSSSDFDYEEKGEDFCCSDSDTDLSECSEFDVISQHVVEDKVLIGSESLCTCNSPCLSEYDVHVDDKFGLGTSSIPLTKTLEGPGRMWSVCGSIAAVRKIPLLGDGSGACSSLDEQLYVNVSAPEGRGAKLSQTLYPEEEEEEVDGEDEMSFSDIDAMVKLDTSLSTFYQCSVCF